MTDSNKEYQILIKCGSVLCYTNFTAVTMTNNHIMDYGEVGLNEILEYCERTGIKTIITDPKRLFEEPESIINHWKISSGFCLNRIPTDI